MFKKQLILLFLLYFIKTKKHVCKGIYEINAPENTYFLNSDERIVFMINNKTYILIKEDELKLQIYDIYKNLWVTGDFKSAIIITKKRMTIYMIIISFNIVLFNFLLYIIKFKTNLKICTKQGKKLKRCNKL